MKTSSIGSAWVFLFMVAFFRHAVGLQPRLVESLRRCRPLLRGRWTARPAAFSSTALSASIAAIGNADNSEIQIGRLSTESVNAFVVDGKAVEDGNMKSGSYDASSGQRAAMTDSVRQESTEPKRYCKPLSISVHVDKEILAYLSQRQSQRNTRFKVSTANQDWTLSHLRSLIEDRFPCLANLPYKLRYSHDNLRKSDQPQLISSTEELRSVFGTMVGSDKTLQFHVHPNPGLLPPNNGVNADPWDATSFTMVSFYTYSPIDDPAALQSRLFEEWDRFNALGRVYVATEGVNAQMAIPSNVFADFISATRKIPLFEEVRFNVDHEMSREDYAKQVPFSALHIRLRKQIVTDGLDFELDLSQSGNELDPLSWHERITDPSAVILDCRNTYETDIGKFRDAIPLHTHTFQGSWEAMQEILQDKPKDTPIYTYCTGGIRCVKINAYLQQKMGFVNTHRLQGGIIHYAQALASRQASHAPDPDSAEAVPAEQGKEEEGALGSPQADRHIAESRFVGVNFVFDERLGARITKDVLTGCDLCGEACDSFANCLNPTCNVLFIQCAKCRSAYHGCCSQACVSGYHAAQALRVPTESKRTYSGPCVDFDGKDWPVPSPSVLPRPLPRPRPPMHASDTASFLTACEEYCTQHSLSEPPILSALRQETSARFPHGLSRMLSGHTQGLLLSLLAATSGARKVLELGTFTGYSTLCLAASVDAWVDSLSRKETLSDEERQRVQRLARTVHTCEIDDAFSAIAQRYFESCAVGTQVVLHRCNAHVLIQSLQKEGSTMDMVFIDADKKSNLVYLRKIIGEDGPAIISPGGLIVVDNTLWKGLVLHKSSSPEMNAQAPDAACFGNAARMLKTADHVHALNEFCASHPSLRALQLPLRDGLTLLRYVPLDSPPSGGQANNL